MKNVFLFIFGMGCFVVLSAQSKRSQNIVIVTMDGMRWQEIFGGADSLLAFDTTASYNSRYVLDRFWASTATERRKKLMPFFWTEIATKGLLLGNRAYGSYVNNANPYWFSYPGYNELFTGYPDTAVKSNSKIPNKNVNVFEFINRIPSYRNKTAVFGSWDVFASIFNEERSGLLINDGYRDLPGKLNERQQLFNRLQHQLPDLFHGGERLDAATFQIAFEYMKANKPRLILFGLGDTDEFAHEGMYDYYLDAARHADNWIREIWTYIQSTPGYADVTTLIVTADHGRGAAADGNWKRHNSKVQGANEIWVAMMGPAVPSLGESKQKAQVYQGQLAATMASLLGEEFKPDHPVLPALSLSELKH